MKKLYGCIIIILVILALMISVKIMTSPPSVKAVEAHFSKHKADILLVTDFLVESEYDSVYIHDDTGHMSVGTSDMEIDELDVLAAIKNLFQNKYSAIIKENNTIYFQQWTRFMDAGCGVAYSINHVDKPETEYMTELKALSCEGWYYLVDDYNEWKSGKRP